MNNLNSGGFKQQGGSKALSSSSSKQRSTTVNSSSLMQHYHSCRYQTAQPTGGVGSNHEQQLRGRRSLSTFPSSAQQSSWPNQPLPTSRSNTFNNRYANVIYDHHDPEYSSNATTHYYISETEGGGGGGAVVDYLDSYYNKESYSNSAAAAAAANYAMATTCHVQGSQLTPDSPNSSIAYDDVEIFNRLTRDDLAIDNSRWLSEKPISVLQLDPADRAVLKIAGKRHRSA